MKLSRFQFAETKRAFSLMELIVVLTVICILFALLIPVAINAIARQKRIGCVSRLKNMGLGYRIFATDHHDLYPWQMLSNAPPAKSFDDALWLYGAISNELSIPKILSCPADTRRAASDWLHLSRTNLSYFISLDSAETFPQSILIGDRNVTTNGVRIGPGIVKVTGQTYAAWDGTIHRLQGNVAMGDGSVQQLSLTRLRAHWTNQEISSVTLAVP